jgi:hypothetical protein
LVFKQILVFHPGLQPSLFSAHFDREHLSLNVCWLVRQPDYLLTVAFVV